MMATGELFSHWFASSEPTIILDVDGGGVGVQTYAPSSSGERLQERLHNVSVPAIRRHFIIVLMRSTFYVHAFCTVKSIYSTVSLS